MKPLAATLLPLLLIFASHPAEGNNLRQISSLEGISNNAVLSLGQDKYGFLWVGTCDGLNMWDGERMQLFPNAWQKHDGLSGNLIEQIAVTRDSLFWIRTNYGLDLFDPADKSVERHPQFQGMYKIACRTSREVLVLTQDRRAWSYDPLIREFVSIGFPYGIGYDNALAMLFDADCNLWICTREGVHRIPVTFQENGTPEFGEGTILRHEAPILCAFADGERICLIDARQTLFEVEISESRLRYVMELQEELADRGNVSSIIRDGDDYLISFYTDGALRLKRTPQTREGYVIEPIDIQGGIFSLLRDARQEIVWIGSDGQGLFQQTRNDVAFRSITYNSLPYRLSKPARALVVDDEGALWIGTKGEGILRIRDFYRQKEFNLQNTRQITTANSALLDNSVYAFAHSHRDVLWIGSDGDGLNYYSYRDHTIHRIQSPVPGALKYIHGLYESDPSTLWVATVGCGVYRVELAGDDARPQIRAVERLHFNDELEIKNFFFTLHPQGDNLMWFGNRGGGAVRYDLRTGESEVLKFDHGRNAIANDIYAIHCARDGHVWFGTSGGLIPLERDSTVCATNRAIHGILEDEKNNLWLSTNRGLIRYTPQTDNTVVYGYSYGLNTIEYSDGACYNDSANGTLFFGGTNGIVTVQQTPYEEPAFAPPVQFRDIRIADEVFSVESLLSRRGVLTLRHDQRIFTLTVSALDYIDGSNYTYFSQLAGLDEQWVANTGRFTFTDLPTGYHELHVRYHNNISGEDSPVYTLPIRIRPAWYASTLAQILYVLIVLLGIGGAIRYYLMRYRRKRAERQQQLEIRRREEIYDSKMSFVTNVTQELTVPLTMISGPCQQILTHAGADGYVRRHAETIRQNVSRLHDLIYMLREFRVNVRETDHPENIELVSMSELGSSVAETFTDYADSNSIRCEIDIEPDLVWPTDRDGISTILNTLLTNAFKHTPYNGTVRLTIRSDGGELLIIVANNSVGVNLEDIEAIFDRYRILDYFERKSERGLSFQGDLRLAICHSTALRMGGDITVESTPNDLTTFTVRLPKLDLTKADDPAARADDRLPSMPSLSGYRLPVREEVRHEYRFDKNRPTVFVMNDNPEITDFVADLFEADYNIKIVDNAPAMTELLKQMHPDIVVCGAFTPQSDALEAIRAVKEGKLTSHIPVILLSSARQIEERIRSVESGADVCLTLPFNVEYLKAVTEQLLKRSQSLKYYYSSAISTYEFSDGKMLHQDDKEFIDRMMQIINDNISNTEISTRFIADSMGVSVRNLYRRLEGILNQTPTHIIKEYRLMKAEQLLTTTKLSIDEIIYKAGFVNRGTFFKCFAAKYGCTPKAYRKQKLSQMQEEVAGASGEEPEKEERTEGADGSDGSERSEGSEASRG